MNETLTPENIKDNLLIVRAAEPDWGTYRVLRKYDTAIWEIRSRAGDRVLMECEFHFWEIAK